MNNIFFTLCNDRQNRRNGINPTNESSIACNEANASIVNCSTSGAVAPVVSRRATTTTTLPTFSSAKLIGKKLSIVLFCLLFGGNVFAQKTYTVGTGTNTDYYRGPVDNYYNYTYSQIIYTASELGGTPGVITTIGFQAASATSEKNNVKIYMINTSKSSFSSATDNVTAGLVKEVYSGNLNCINGWKDFTLTNPFVYTGENLVVTIVDQSGDYDGNSYKFYSTTTTQYLYKCWYSDGSSTSNPFSPNTDMSKQYSQYRPNTRFNIINLIPNVTQTNTSPLPLCGLENANFEASLPNGATVPSGYKYHWYAGSVSCSTEIINGQNGATISGTNNYKLSYPATSGTNIYCRLESDNKYTQTTAFGYSGAIQTYTVPCGVSSLKLEVWGAEGGLSQANASVGAYGGKGGYSYGNYASTSGQTLYIGVGGKGTDAVVGQNSPGGYNGGGRGTWDNGDDESSGGGGGATHIATANGILQNLSGNTSAVLIVAGGGGGASWKTSGGYGGGTSAGSGAGSGTVIYGTFGKGADAQGIGDNDGVAGGGGGWQGGNAYNTTAGASYAAGGTGYIGGVTSASTTGGVNTGHGGAAITTNQTASICGPAASKAINCYTCPTIPAPTATSASVVDCGTATISVSDPGSGYTVKWYSTASSTTVLQTGTSYTVTASGTNTYYAEVSESHGCKSSRTAITATVHPTFSAGSVSGSISVCEGSSVDVDIDASTPTGKPEFVYKWYKDGDLIAGATSEDYTFPAASVAELPGGTTVIFTREVLNTCAGSGYVASSGSFTLTIIEQPTATVTNGDQHLCKDASATALGLDVSGPSGMSPTYQWYRGGTMLTNETNSTYTPPTGTAGTSSYHCIVSFGGETGCESATSDNASVEVYALPTVTTPTANYTNTCVGTGVTLEVSASGGNGTAVHDYYWTAPSGGGTSQSTGTTNSCIMIPTAGGTYTYDIKVTDEHGCTASSSKSGIKVYNSVKITGAPASSIASGTSVTLTATPRLGGSDGTPGDCTYAWTSTLTNGVIGTSRTLTQAPSMTTYYTVTATVTDAGCTLSQSQIINVNFSAGGSDEICNGSVVIYCTKNGGGNGSSTSPMKLTQALLLAQGINNDNTGTYSVSASNPIVIRVAKGDYLEESNHTFELQDNVIIDGGWTANTTTGVWTKSNTRTMIYGTFGETPYGTGTAQTTNRVAFKSVGKTGWRLQDLTIDVTGYNKDANLSGSYNASSGKGNSVYGIYISGNDANVEVNRCEIIVGNGGGGKNGGKGSNGSNGDNGKDGSGSTGGAGGSSSIGRNGGNGGTGYSCDNAGTGGSKGNGESGTQNNGGSGCYNFWGCTGSSGTVGSSGGNGTVGSSGSDGSNLSFGEYCIIGVGGQGGNGTHGYGGNGGGAGGGGEGGFNCGTGAGGGGGGAGGEGGVGGAGGAGGGASIGIYYYDVTSEIDLSNTNITIGMAGSGGTGGDGGNGGSGGTGGNPGSRSSSGNSSGGSGGKGGAGGAGGAGGKGGNGKNGVSYAIVKVGTSGLISSTASYGFASTNNISAIDYGISSKKGCTNSQIKVTKSGGGFNTSYYVKDLTPELVSYSDDTAIMSFGSTGKYNALTTGAADNPYIFITQSRSLGEIVKPSEATLDANSVVNICVGSSGAFIYDGVLDNGEVLMWSLVKEDGTEVDSYNEMYSGTQHGYVLPATTLPTGTYYVKLVINNNCCGLSKPLFMKVKVNELPLAALNGEIAVCAGSDLTLTASGGGQYSWGGGVFADAYTHTVTAPASPETYTVTVKANGCTATASHRLNAINAVPSAPSVTGATTVCTGRGTTLTASGGDSFNWYSDSGCGTEIGTDADYSTPDLTVAATYYVQATNDYDNVYEDVRTFDAPGFYQVAVPEGTTSAKLEVWGAEGGRGLANGLPYAYGGRGGYAVGTYTASAGTVLHVVVGGRGVDGIFESNSQGGYNGGGNGTWDANDDESSGSGGGATHIATASGLLSSLSSNVSAVLVVAGGGGGGSWQQNGGYGGGTNGGQGDNNGGLGGQQSVRTAESPQINGTFGHGANGSGTGNGNGVAGGGGGYYGGNANSGGSSNPNAGGGGSGYVKSGLTSPSLIAGNASMPTHDGTSTMIGNTDNGYAKITFYISTPKSCTSTVKDVTVEVNSPSVGTLTMDDVSICYGRSASLALGVSDNHGDLSYQWSNDLDDDLGDGATLSGITTAGSYTVGVTATNTLNGLTCTDDDSKSATVSFDNPDAIAIGANDGDLIYTGCSTDWNGANNWIEYHSAGGTYTLASAPTSSKNVIIGGYSCVSAPSTINLNVPANVGSLTIAEDITLSGSSNTINIYGDMVNNGTFNAPVNFAGTTTLSGSGTTIFQGITIGSSFTSGSSPINLRGNWTNNGTYTAGSGLIVFDGTSSQTIGGSSTTAFKNLEFSNTSGITIDKEPTITGTATFSSGVVTGDVTFGTSATAGTASLTSHIDGKVTKSGNANGFTFPTGDNGNLGTVAVTSNANNVSVQYFGKSAGFGVSELPRWWNVADMCGDNPFNHISNMEYWKISSSTEMTANFNAQAASDMHFNDNTGNRNPANINMAFYGSNCWKNVGGTTSVDGNTIKIEGAVIPASTRDISGNYSTFGSTNENTWLPIELVSFTATCNGRSSLVEWTTATEKNNDYFSLERSDDAVNFTEIARVAGAGNSIEPIDYSYTDYGIHGGDNYYRLVQVDYDGTRTVSEIVVANCIESKVDEPEVQAYPNPFSGELTLVLDNFNNRAATIEVYDMLGKLIYTEKASAPQNSYETILNLSNLPSGAYNVRVSTTDFVINKNVVKN